METYPWNEIKQEQKRNESTRKKAQKVSVKNGKTYQKKNCLSLCLLCMTMAMPMPMPMMMRTIILPLQSCFLLLLLLLRAPPLHTYSLQHTHVYTNTHPHIHKSTTEGHWCTTKKSVQNNNEMYLNSAKRVPLSTQCSQRTHTRLYCSNCTPMPWASIGSSTTKLYIRIINYQEGSLISCAQKNDTSKEGPKVVRTYLLVKYVSRHV